MDGCEFSIRRRARGVYTSDSISLVAWWADVDSRSRRSLQDATWSTPSKFMSQLSGRRKKNLKWWWVLVNVGGRDGFAMCQ